MMSDIDDQRLKVLREAEQLKMQGEFVRALALLEELIADDPDDVVVLEEIADNELSLENFDRSEVAARRAVTLDKESYTGHYILGFIASHAGQWKESATELRLANALKPNNPEILRCLGWSLFSDGDHVQGVVTLERALNLDSANVLTLCDLGVSYVQLQNFAKAKALFDRAIELDPSNTRALDCQQMVQRLQKHVDSVRPVEGK